MENKKLNELKQVTLSKEETEEYLKNLLLKLRKDGIEIKQWIDNFKKQHGVKDEDL